MVIRVGDVRRTVGRIDRHLEEVEERAISGGGAQIAAKTVDADRARVDDVVARLEHAPRGATVDGLRHIDVPLVVDVVLRAGLGTGPALCAVEDHVDDAGLARVGPRHDRRVHACRVWDESGRRRGVPSGACGVGLDHDAVAVGPDRVDPAAGVDRGYREDSVVARAERTVIDLVVPPADDRCARRGKVGHRADGLIHAVEVSGSREALVDVVLRAIGRDEDGVQRQARGGPARHDVPESVPGRRRWRVDPALPLWRGHVGGIDDRAVLNVGLPAIS